MLPLATEGGTAQFKYIRHLYIGGAALLLLRISFINGVRLRVTSVSIAIFWDSVSRQCEVVS